MKSRDLSFVVQGLVNRDISPLTGAPITQSCLASLRQHYPDAEVILSTWRGVDVDGLDFDKVVFNDDPGAWNAFRPGAAVKLDNTNRQIVSTRNGLRQATRKYAAKIRCDMIFQGNDWMAHYHRYPARGKDWIIFRERVITCSMWARDPRCPYTDQPLHPPDWMHIGLKEDIQLLWDIDLQPEPESSQWFLNRRVNLPDSADDDIRRYSPEQYLWCTLLKKFGEVHFEERGQNSDENTRLTEITFANNLIILDLPQFPFIIHKYPPPVSPAYRYYAFIAHREWKHLYHQHS
ncbi:MAG TPA: WavE lipopolysaccharide synthesis family protein, partial [Bryobacteraceae bacterium]|nr:WavE lipopolysaccharide synthesis family protein [Bryobacteraceae bacterium]